MTIDEIKELIQVVNETGIAELLVQRGEHSVRIVRTVVPNQERVVPMSAAVPTPAIATSIPSLPGSMTLLEQTSTPIAPPVVPEATEKDVLVTSPIVGTYYDSASPDAPKFVKVGDRVDPKQVLCIIESMKLMNEIEAEIAGIVVAKYVDNGRPVEYGESLFSIRPDAKS